MTAINHRSFHGQLGMTAINQRSFHGQLVSIGGENRPKWMMLRHWERFALETDTKPQLVKNVMADIIMRIESALPIVTAALRLVVVMSDELVMINNIEALIVLSLAEMKDKLKIKA